MAFWTPLARVSQRRHRLMMFGLSWKAPVRSNCAREAFPGQLWSPAGLIQSAYLLGKQFKMQLFFIWMLEYSRSEVSGI